MASCPSKRSGKKTGYVTVSYSERYVAFYKENNLCFLFVCKRRREISYSWKGLTPVIFTWASYTRPGKGLWVGLAEEGKGYHGEERVGLEED